MGRKNRILLFKNFFDSLRSCLTFFDLRIILRQSAMKLSIRILLVLLPLLSCNPFSSQPPRALVSGVILQPDYEPTDVVYRPTLTEPRRYELELLCGLDSVSVMSPILLGPLADSLGMSVKDLPLWYIWTAEPVERATQRDIVYRKIQPDIALRYDDKLNGNRIRFWDMSGLCKPEQKHELTRRFSFTCYRLACDVDSTRVGRFQKDRAFYKFYTKSEPWLEYQGAIADTADGIINGCRNPYNQMLKIDAWLRQHGVYKYPPEKRGAAEMLRTMQGDCGQFAYLFIAMCRSVGIPARLVCGFKLIEEKQWGYHVWAECFMPAYGWLPVDLTDEDNPGVLSNDRLITSVGMNIPLPRAPAWADYKNSDLQMGITDYMQMATMVMAGITGSRYTEIRMIKAQPL